MRLAPCRADNHSKVLVTGSVAAGVSVLGCAGIVVLVEVEEGKADLGPYKARISLVGVCFDSEFKKNVVVLLGISMARILGYIATSLDGLIVAEGDDLGWLYKYNDMDLGEHDYGAFLERARTVVMGRSTYDFIAREPSPWGFGDQRVIVVTSQPLENPKGPLEVRNDVDSLITELRALDDGDVWMLGGGQLQMAFIERGALDEIEIYVIPEILGAGRPLFPLTGHRASPTLISAKAMDKGCVRLHYRM